MRDISGYEGKYAITSCGKVYSYKRKIFLTPGERRWGYQKVSLCKNGKVKDYYVHRLVAEAYLENPEHKTQVNHKDLNKKNNSLCNLEWATPSENIIHYKENIKI